MRIVKNGLYNEVDEALFKKSYEPKGWKRVGEPKPVESIENQAINEPNGEQKVKELKDNEKKKKTQKFNDKIIKE